MNAIAILLLAAGSSSRMRGADKLLEPVDGVPVLRRQAMAALSLGGPVLVALRPDRPLRQAALDGLDVTCVPVPDADTGMSASIRAGLAALPAQARGVAILPADMPEITASDMAKVIAAFLAAGSAHVARGTAADGTSGHPVVFPARLFPALGALAGDMGARPALADQDIIPVPLPRRHALTDLDTPEDWAAWRKARAR